MRKCGAVLSSGYYSPSSTSELVKEKERKKILIQLAPDDLNVTFGECKLTSAKPCSDYSLRFTGRTTAPLCDVWRYPPKASSVVTLSARPTSELSCRTRRDVLDLTVTPSSLRTRPSSPGDAPVSIQLASSPSNTRPPSSSHGRRPHSRTIRLSSGSSSPRRSRTPQAADAAAMNVSTKSFHLENNPVQSVTVRTMPNVSIHTQQLRDGVEFQLDGKPGVQLSIKLGQSTSGETGMRNCIKIETKGPTELSQRRGGGPQDERVTRLQSYQRPTVSHLIHTRMTQLHKALRK